MAPTSTDYQNSQILRRQLRRRTINSTGTPANGAADAHCWLHVAYDLSNGFLNRSAVDINILRLTEDHLAAWSGARRLWAK